MVSFECESPVLSYRTSYNDNILYLCSLWNDWKFSFLVLLATWQVLSSPRGPVATVLGSAGLEHLTNSSLFWRTSRVSGGDQGFMSMLTIANQRLGLCSQVGKIDLELTTVLQPAGWSLGLVSISSILQDSTREPVYRVFFLFHHWRILFASWKSYLWVFSEHIRSPSWCSACVSVSRLLFHRVIPWLPRCPPKRHLAIVLRTVAVSA